MRKITITLATALVIGFSSLSEAQQTITDATWPTKTDQDGDGYSRSRTLRLNFNSSTGVFISIQIYLYLDGGYPTVYYTGYDGSYLPAGGSYLDIPGIGTSSTGGELPHGSYDLVVQLRSWPNTSNILAQRDYSGDSDLNNETFETASEDNTPVYPDLSVINAAAPTSAVAGSQIAVSCRVRNSGQGTAGSSNVGYYLSTSATGTDTYLDYDGVSSLAPGAYSDESQNVTIPTSTIAGNYYIVFVADYQLVVNEGANENNNKTSVPITITVPKYTVSGRVESDKQTFDIVQGAIVNIGGLTGQSDNAGNYTIPDVPKGNYTISVSRSGYAFPTSSYVLPVNNNVTNADFSGHCQATAEVTASIPSTFVPGQPYSFTVSLRNVNTAISDVSAWLDVSIPSVTSGNPTVEVLSPSGFDKTPQKYPQGTSITKVDQSTGIWSQIPAQYLLISGQRTSTIYFNQTWSYTVQFTPTSSTPINIYVKGSIGDSRDPSTGPTGQQGLWERSYSVTPQVAIISGTLKGKNWPNAGLGGFVVQAVNVSSASLVYNSTPSEYWTGNYSIPNVSPGSYNLSVVNGSDWTVTPSVVNSVTVNNNTAVNFTLESIAAPSVRIDATPTSYTEGQPFDVKVFLKNAATSVNNTTAYLDISFPDNPTVQVLESPGWSAAPVRDPGYSPIYYANDPNTHIVTHRIVMAEWTGSIASGQEQYVKLRVTPTSTSDIRIWYRGTLGDKHDPTSGLNPPSGPLDQQGWLVYERKIRHQNTIAGLVGTVKTASNLTLFGQEFTVYGFQKDGSASTDYVYLPFHGNDPAPIEGNIVDGTDIELGHLVLDSYLFENQGVSFQNLGGTELNDFLIPLRDHSNLDTWWRDALEVTFPPLRLFSKRKVDRVTIGNISFWGANETGKALATGGASTLSVVWSGIEELYDLGTLESIKPGEIQGLAFAQAYYGGRLDVFDRMNFLSSRANLELLLKIGDVVVHLRDCAGAGQILEAAQAAIERGDIVTFNAKYGDFITKTDGILKGLVWGLAADWITNSLGWSTLEKETEMFAWLSDAHNEAMFVCACDLVKIANRILALKNATNSPEARNELKILLNSYLFKKTYILQALRAEHAANQATYLQRVRTNVLWPADVWVGATQSNVTQAKSDFDFLNTYEYEDAKAKYLEFARRSNFFSIAYDGALKALMSQHSNELLRVQSGVATAILGATTNVPVVISNDYATEMTTIAAAGASGNFGIFHTGVNVSAISAGQSATVQLPVTVPANWYTQTSGVDEVVVLPLHLSWSVAGEVFEKVQYVHLVVRSQAKLHDIYSERNLYRPGDIANIHLTYSGVPGGTQVAVPGWLLDPSGSAQSISMPFSTNGEIIQTYAIKDGPFGAHGMRAFIAKPGGEILAPLTYVNKVFYVVPRVIGDIAAIVPQKCLVIYPQADIAVAEDVAGIWGLQTSSLVEIESHSVAELFQLARSNITVLIGGQIANPLVNDLVQRGLLAVSLTHSGDATIQITENSFADKTSCVVAGYELRDTQLAGIGFLDSWKTHTSSVCNLKVMLQGPYSAGAMSVVLRTGGQIPLSQPYNIVPWSYSGTESVTSIPVGVVDWVLVDLRSGTNAATKVATRAAFIKNDGSVVDLDGTSPVTFSSITNGNYYVVLRHRNHLSVMSSSALELNSSSVLYDFTTGQAKAYGTSPMKLLTTGVFGMYAGDANGSGIVSAADANGVFNALNATGYNANDANLSGIVTAADANVIFTNLNATTRVP